MKSRCQGIFVGLFPGSVEGLVNPVFDDESRTYTEERDLVDGVSSSPLLRPQSLNLSSTRNHRDLLLHNASLDSLDQAQALYRQGLLNSAVTNEVGSSLSMDSGNPLGTQSLESLDDRTHSICNVSANTATARCVYILFCSRGSSYIFSYPPALSRIDCRNSLGVWNSLLFGYRLTHPLSLFNQ